MDDITRIDAQIRRSEDLTKLNEITVSATDVYNNTQITQFKIEKTESDKPIIAIETPIATFEMTDSTTGLSFPMALITRSSTILVTESVTR